MLSSRNWPGLCLVAVFLAAEPVSGLADDKLVVVELVDGGGVQAAMDPRTDGERLWLTTRLQHGQISQSIPWTRVSRVEIDGREFEARIVQAAVATIREANPLAEPGSSLPGVTRIDGHSLRTAVPPSSTSKKRAPVRPSDHPVRRVQALSVSAWLGNWDPDVTADGLVVELMPCDAYGSLVDCDGTVEITLRTWKYTGRSDYLETRSERWTRSVKGSDFSSGPVTLHLPFRTIQPSASSDWWPHGVLHIRLVSSGSHVVERTLTDLRLRPFEPTRDHLEQRTGRRYFPWESVRYGANVRPRD